ncbi:unnamed protein product [Albugo candida]|nr:unnamed protein product [Albugo candida]|eukprot:CCI40561.1 unnamed protein product [Albugo candida]
MLPSHEQLQVSRFLNEKHALLALLSRLLQRTLIHLQLNIPYQDIEISRSHGQKPHLSRATMKQYNVPSEWNYNVSHDGTLVVIVSDDVDLVGVDIVDLQRPQILNSAGKIGLYHSFKNRFTDSEWAYIMEATNQTESTRRLYELWSLKEAYIKAVGVGMRLELQKCEFKHCEINENDHKIGWRMRLEGRICKEWQYLSNKLNERYIVSIAMGSQSFNSERVYPERIRAQSLHTATNIVWKEITIQELMRNAHKKSALAMAIRQIESSFGKGSVMQLGSAKIAERVETISTGSLTLDYALGIGGLPRGRIIEIYGPESSGKTTLALSCIAQAQKKDEAVCAFIDAEHAIDAHYAKALGVNIEDLYVSQPDSGEQALEITDTLIRSGAVDLVVLDSVAALVPRAELEGEMGDQQIALQARLMSQALRKLTGSLSKSHCTLIFLNQIRQKVGVIFGSPEVTSGGTALRYYASVRLDIRRQTQIKQGDAIIGNETVVKVAKNKLASPFKIARFDMIYGKGIDRMSELLDLGTQHGLINRSGAWYSLVENEAPMGQGRAKAKAFLELHEDIAKKIEQSLRDTLFEEPALADMEQEGTDDSENAAVKEEQESVISS